MKASLAGMKVKATGADKDSGLTDGQFLAYASVFGNTDSYGDVVQPGAFKKSLAFWEAADKVLPLLFGHNFSDPDYNIGYIVSAEEDEKGLLVLGELDMESPKAAQVYRLIKGRRLAELSFAYNVVDASKNEAGGLDLKELQLLEVSLVPVGANSETEILAVKAGELASSLKAGRSISAANLSKLEAAVAALQEVLSAAKPAEEPAEEETSTEKAQSHIPEEKAAAEASGKSASPSPETPRLDYFSRLLSLTNLD